MLLFLTLITSTLIDPGDSDHCTANQKPTATSEFDLDSIVATVRKPYKHVVTCPEKARCQRAIIRIALNEAGLEAEECIPLFPFAGDVTLPSARCGVWR